MKEPGNVQQALLVEDCISHYLRVFLSTWWARIRFSCLGCNVSRKLISIFMMYCSWIQNIDVPPCGWECVWVDIDLIGPQWWLTALTTCCYNGQWGTCVCMWKNYCGTSEWNLPLWTDPCSHCITWLTVRTWALSCLFPLLKMYLHRLFNAAERQQSFFYFFSKCNYIIAPTLYIKLDIYLKG